MFKQKNAKIRESQIKVILRFLLFGLLISGSLLLYYGFALLNFIDDNSPNFRITFPIALLFSIFFILGIRILKAGYYIQIVLTFIWGSFGVIFWVMQTLGLGFYSPIFYLVFVLIIMSGYLLGLRHLIIFSITACLSIIFIFLQELLGWRTTEFPVPRVDLLIFVLFAIIFCTLGTRVTLVELNNRSNELEEIQNHLEELVQERTVQLGEALNKAEKANQAKSIFLATMSHELRTPLNAIIGYTEMLEEDLNEGVIHDDSVEDLARVRKSGRHLLSLINAVLDLSKVEAGEESFCLEPCLVEEIIEEVMISARPLCKQSRNSLSVEPLKHDKVDVDEETYVIADQQKLCQVLLNLVSNANKFTQDGAIKMTVAFDEKASVVKFSIKDTGIGIPETEIDQLFEPFIQLENRYNRKYEGTGLGLAISKQYCQMMGGEITATNHTDGGAIVTVTLPAI